MPKTNHGNLRDMPPTRDTRRAGGATSQTEETKVRPEAPTYTAICRTTAPPPPPSRLHRKGVTSTPLVQYGPPAGQQQRHAPATAKPVTPQGGDFNTPCSIRATSLAAAGATARQELPERARRGEGRTTGQGLRRTYGRARLRSEGNAPAKRPTRSRTSCSTPASSCNAPTSWI